MRLAAYNVALGGIVGGVGALINGDDAPPLRRLARGAGWGAAGGGVAYVGKWATGEIGESGSLAYGLPARLVHDVGLSVVENAAHDRPPLDRLAAHVGFVRLDVRPTSGDVQARLLPLSALAYGVMLADGNSDLALGRSLVYGTPLFLGDGRQKSPILSRTTRAYALLSTVYLSREADDFSPLAGHELVHVLQHHEFVRAEAALRAPLDAPLRESAAYRAVSKWVYLDSPALQWISYFVAAGGVNDSPCYFNNWFERESEAFGYRRRVGTCP